MWIDARNSEMLPMYWRNRNMTQGVRRSAAVSCFACVVGLTLVVVALQCRADDAIAPAKERLHDKKVEARQILLFAPTTQWLPKPQIDIPAASADDEATMRPYTERIPGSEATQASKRILLAHGDHIDLCAETAIRVKSENGSLMGQRSNV